jgi:hypothetical protein
MSELSGPKFMTREEFKQYGAKLREKTQQYKRMKQDLAELRYSVGMREVHHIMCSPNLSHAMRDPAVQAHEAGPRRAQVQCWQIIYHVLKIRSSAVEPCLERS